jgi:hypothetical protein
MFIVQKLLFFFVSIYQTLCINVVGNFLHIVCIYFKDRNIVKHIACIHYTENREGNHGNLLWFETSSHNDKKISNGCNNNCKIILNTQV